ncbi:hypothetical protein [Sphingobium aromaticivastans]|uniref:hypothetical protein n=1 Tax=Sphingobium aromaticivastans TaxID=1778665 RepID=UPI00301645E9
MENVVTTHFSGKNFTCRNSITYQPPFRVCTPLTVQLGSSKLRQTVGGLLADLMRHPADYHYRSLHPSGFKGAAVGYRPFTTAIQGMKALGYLEVVMGFWQSEKPNQPGMATRYRLTPAFLKYAADFRVCAVDWSGHFRPPPTGSYNPNPVLVRSAAVKDWNKRLKGALLPISPDDAVAAALGQQVNEINHCRPSFILWAEDKRPNEPYRAYSDYEVHSLFYRGFSNVNGGPNGWNKGGRLYALGGYYQQFPETVRATITINGEATKEIDLTASHLTILYACHGIPIDSVHAYEIEGFPRAVIKAWVTMTLGHKGFHTRWHKDVVAKVKDKKGIDLKAYSIKAVQAAVLEKHPLLRDWESSEIRWGDLQYLESKVIVDTVHALTVGQGIPALPVHDSLIVPVSKVEIARKVLIEMFEKHIGMTPALKTE